MRAEVDGIIAKLVMVERMMAAVAFRRRQDAAQTIGAADWTEAIKVFRRLAAVRATEAGDGKKDDHPAKQQPHSRHTNPDRQFIRDEQCGPDQKRAGDHELNEHAHALALPVRLRLEINLGCSFHQNLS